MTFEGHIERAPRLLLRREQGRALPPLRLSQLPVREDSA